MSEPEDAEMPLLGLQMMEEFSLVADGYQGMRAQLVERGFTEQQAGDLVVETQRQVTEHLREKNRKAALRWPL